VISSTASAKASARRHVREGRNGCRPAGCGDEFGYGCARRSRACSVQIPTAGTCGPHCLEVALCAAEVLSARNGLINTIQYARRRARSFSTGCRRVLTLSLKPSRPRVTAKDLMSPHTSSSRELFNQTKPNREAMPCLTRRRASSSRHMMTPSLVSQQLC